MEKIIIKGKLKRASESLTDDYFILIKGDEDKRIGKIQLKIRKTTQQVKELLFKL